MQKVRFYIAGAAATVAVLGAVGFTTTAQAQPTVSQVHDPSVPAGIETAVNLTACPTGNTVSSVTPAPPGTINVVKKANKVKLAGDWTVPGTKTFTVHCSGGSTTSTAVTIQAAPPENSATAVGSDTTEFLYDQLSGDYNATVASSASHLYSWDALNPNTNAQGDSIAVKSGCTHIARPDGSSAGITTLSSFQKTKDGKFFCSSLARSSRARASTDPAFAPGGIAFVDLGGDAETWAAQPTTNAPASLTLAQLQGIYNCTITNWSQVGGNNAPIHAFIPQSGSGTRAFWLTALGIANPGACVSDVGGTLEENEGTNPALNDPNAIVDYSIGKYIGEKVHSAKCFNTACTANASGKICAPSGSQNLFGCNIHGTLVLKQINGVSPTTGTGAKTVINGSFPSNFQRTVFTVVPYDPKTTDHIPGGEAGAPGGINLETIFGVNGYVCKNATAKADLRNYGFLATPLCGVTG